MSGVERKFKDNTKDRRTERLFSSEMLERFAINKPTDGKYFFAPKPFLRRKSTRRDVVARSTGTTRDATQTQTEHN